MELKIDLPRQTADILRQLNDHGFEAYIVGGCVRDSLLGRVPDDWDITTSALPWQVKSVFRRTVDTGIKHGTVTVMMGNKAYEVTTYRIDGEYEDRRHPKDVEFTSDLTEDLKRRDFTINAMAYNDDAGLVDEFDGAGDLRRRLIRCVGEADERFSEDALRVLRAVRFAAQLGFDIEEKTLQAVILKAPGLIDVSKERIQAELTKLLLSDGPERIRQVFDTGMAPFISDSFTKIDPDKVHISPDLPEKKYMRWAALLEDLDVNDAENILRELKMDNDTIYSVKTLIIFLRRPIGDTPAKIRDTMSLIPHELFEDLIVFKEKQDDAPETEEELEQIKRESDEILARGDCIALKDLAVTGNDLIKLGFTPGKTLGEVLDSLFSDVLIDPEKNDRGYLLERAAKMLEDTI